ncbi:hypothetical protein PNEG_02229 [Pneumocystis murina B123]|uniref:PIH1 N-terminal domain-containing protein n=1 Tax=Pneumocystis murina (strain B123) TaxID=1069680 RepID=M7NR99_PNEMU|nr:hypothetical protein PNEG_02229 [Pneumocystis murina B123]EMR09646.1 hypothetical protein PNEG_02229 [Pneumocystis murina B123]
MPFLDIPEKINPLKSLNIISNNHEKYEEYDHKENSDFSMVEKIMDRNFKKHMSNLLELPSQSGKSQKNTKEIYVLPLPGFVVKTIQTGDNKKRFPQGTKVFLNICHSDYVTPPKDKAGYDIIPKIMRGWHWEIPVVISIERWDADKAGRKCLVIDCCCNTSVMELCKEDSNVRLFFIETCLELVEDKTGMILSREYVIPKMKAKGELQPSILEVDNISGVKIEETNTNKIIPLEGFGKNISRKLENKKDVINKNTYISSAKTNIQNKISKLTKPVYTVEKFLQLNNTEKSKIVIDLPLVENSSYLCLELIEKDSLFSLIFYAKNIYDELEIPISEFYNRKKSHIEAFFVLKKKKLYIFIQYI